LHDVPVAEKNEKRPSEKDIKISISSSSIMRVKDHQKLAHLLYQAEHSKEEKLGQFRQMGVALNSQDEPIRGASKDIHFP